MPQIRLKSLLLEGSSPVAGASYVGDFETQTHAYHLWMFRVGKFKVYVASDDNGDVAHHNDGPWMWNSEREAAKQIAKWR
jgi:hypothetical protein